VDIPPAVIDFGPKTFVDIPPAVIDFGPKTFVDIPPAVIDFGPDCGFLFLVPFFLYF
jgi:hypothetical protein